MTMPPMYPSSKPSSQSFVARAGNRRLSGGLVCLAMAWCMFSTWPAWAQDGRSTVNEVEILLEKAPSTQTGELPGLRRFSSSTFDTGSVTLTLLGAFAAVLLAAPGLAIFYCGLSNSDHRTQTLIQYLFLAAVMSLAWVLWIYSLAFSRNENSFDIDKREIFTSEKQYQKGNRFIGGFEHTALTGFDSNLQDDLPRYPLRRVGDKIPHLLFMAFEMTLFIAAAAPLVVLLPRRWGLPGATIFFVLWGTVVYAPIAYWIWGGGWHAVALDSAGGIVTHLTVGCSSLALAVSSRRDIPVQSTDPQVDLAKLA